MKFTATSDPIGVARIYEVNKVSALFFFIFLKALSCITIIRNVSFRKRFAGKRSRVYNDDVRAFLKIHIFCAVMSIIERQTC